MGSALIACEFSGIVCAEFRRRGHEAWSCDVLPTEGNPAWHIQGDAIEAAYSRPWDILIAHPPCTYLANSGAKHLYAGMKKENGPNAERWANLGAAAQFFLTLWNAPIPRKCIENPIMLGHARRLFGIPKHNQIIQPYEYGHGETKATCLWLHNLPDLEPTDEVAGREQKVFRMAPSPDRWKDRSRTFRGIAQAMADQWGALITDTPNGVSAASAPSARSCDVSSPFHEANTGTKGQRNNG